VADFTQRLANLPTFLLVLGFAAIGVGMVIAADTVLRARLHAQSRAEAGRTAAVMLGVLANIYAVLIAFVIVQGWTNLQQAQTYVDAQATALTQIRENTKVLDRTDEVPIDNALDDYAKSVLTHDFPSMEENGTRSPVTTALLDDLFKSVRRVKPQGREQVAFYDQTVDRLDNIVEARQAAVSASDGSLPSPLYVLLALGGIVVIVMACALNSEHRRSHLLIVGSIACVIAFMLAIVVGFDHPFTGGIAVDDRPIRTFLLEPTFDPQP
jgi:Protein of unknown function (DUF4239)